MQAYSELWSSCRLFPGNHPSCASSIDCCYQPRGRLSLCSPSIAYSQKFVAHRGASQEAPENTLASFRLAWEQGADAIEGDFYLTKDQRIVCLHDANTKRTCRQSG